MGIEPKIEQTVKFRERYVSAALNKKLAGILAPGVYRGFNLVPSSVPMEVLVENEPDGSSSVAVVERDGYSLTLHMTSSGSVTIPAAGTWYICLDAYYSPYSEGYQRIVVREKAESYHVVLGKVVVEDTSAPIVQDSISYTEKTTVDKETKEELAKVYQILESIGTVKTHIATIEEEIAENGVYTLPEGLEYRVGENCLSVSWEGLECYLGKQFEEVQLADSENSNQIKFLFPVSAGSEVKIDIRPYADMESSGIVTDTTSLKFQVAQIQEQLASLSESVAYISIDETTDNTEGTTLNV